MPSPELHLVGHVCLDIAPGMTGPVTMEPGALSQVGAPGITVGGAVGNGARAVAGLGRSAVLTGMVGDDAFGSVCRETLEALLPGGVRLGTSASSATSYSVVIQPPASDRSFWHHTGANDDFDGTIDLVGAPILHFGYPTLVPTMTRDGGTPTVDLFSRVTAQGSATSLDLSYCAENSPLRHYDWGGYFRAVLPLTDVFCPSWDDLVSAGCGGSGRRPHAVVAAAERFLGEGAGIVLLSLGEDGAYLATAGEDRLERFCTAVGGDADSWAGIRQWIPAAPVDRFVTANGAGDVFNVAFLLGALDGLGGIDAATRAAEVASRAIGGRPLRAETYA